MSQQVTKQVVHQSTPSTVETAPPTEVNEQSAAVSDDAACCLADIDAVLEDCADREPTDEEIAEKGKPDYWDYIDDSGDSFDDERYTADMERFKQAYENVYGVEYISGCVC